MTDITSLIERLVASGADPVVAACVVAEAVVAGHASTPHRKETKPSAAALRMNNYRDRREAMGLPRVFKADQYRAALEQRDGKQCIYCRATEALVVDHIHPLFLGGNDDIGNLGLACRACNGGKAGRPLEEAGMSIVVDSAKHAHEGYRERTPSEHVHHEHCSQEPRTPANNSEHVRGAENAHISYLPSSNNSQEKKESKKERKPRKRYAPLCPDWAPSLHSYQVAEQCGQNVQIVEQIFRDYLKSSGKLYADYDAAFNNFIRNQQRFSRGISNGNSKNSRGGSLIDALDRRIAEAELAEKSDLALPTGAVLSLPNRSIR